MNAHARGRTRSRSGVLAAVVVVSTLVATAPVEAQSSDVPVVAVEEVRTLELDSTGVTDPVAVAASSDGRSIYVVDETDRETAVVVDFAEHETGEVSLPAPLAADETLSLDAGGGDVVAVDPSGAQLDDALKGLDAETLGLSGFQGVEVEASGDQYVGDADNNQVLVLDSSGELSQVLDLSAAGVGHLGDVAVAPSGDQTDDPETLSLYVVDDGSDPAVVKEISTTALQTNMAAAVSDTATVIQTINTGTGINPNSPDSSGISWLTGSNQLVLSDSEVNEYSYYESNVWHMTTSGTVNSTGETLAWSSEPTGLTIDNAGARSFTTDDNEASVTEVALGADGVPGTADDTIVREFSTLGYGNSDPEDVAYDTSRGWLHIVDGANREVFSIDPGANGVFDGGGDDVITQFDTEVFGVLDPEGIAYDTANDTLTVVDYRDTTAVEFTVSGSMIREIDMSASSLNHPAGVTWAPSSDGLSTSLWVVDRGIDGSSPRDGLLVELAVPSIGGPPEADIFVSPTSLAFGSVIINSSSTNSVTVTNTGTGPLAVTSTALGGPDASLFSIDSGGAPFSLGPGTSQVIDLSFSPTVVGSYSATLTIDSDDPDEPSVVVSLSGDGVDVPPPADEVAVEAVHQGGSSGEITVASDPVPVTPGRLYLAVVATKGYEDVVGVTGLGGSWSLVDGQCSARNQTGMTVYSTTSASSSGVVTATLSGTPAHSAIAVVEYSGADSAMPVGTPVSANTIGIDGDCSGGTDNTSYSLPLTTTTADSMVTTFAAIRNRKHTPGAGFTEIAEFSQGTGGNTAGMAISTRATPSPTAVDAAGTFSRRVDWSVVAVEIRGGPAGPPIPDISVEPASLSFGSVIVNNSSSGSVTVSNTGTGPLAVSSTALGGPDASLFSIDSGGGAFSLGPGMSRVIDLSFSPTVVGSYSATLTIDSDDPDEPSVVVSLSGDGVDVPPPADEVTVEAVYQGGSTGLAEVSSSAVSVTPGRLYLAVVSTKRHRSVQSVTGLGGSWELVDEQCAGRSQTGLTVYSTTSASSSGPVTAVLDGTPANAVIAVIEYGGADSAVPLGSPVSANTVGLDGACSGGVDNSSYSVPVTTTTSNSLVSGFVAIRNRRHTPGAGFTEILEVSQGSGGNTVGLAGQTQLVPTPATVDSSGSTSSTVDWAVVAVEIRSG